MPKIGRLMKDPSTGEAINLDDVAPLQSNALGGNDRITIVTQFRLERDKEQPYSFDNIQSRLLEERLDDLYYTRRQVFTEEWTPIDLGWIGESAGTIIVEHMEGNQLTTHPTPEEKQLLETKIVELSYSHDSNACDLLYYKSAVIKYPSIGSRLYGRCRNGSANCRVHIATR